MAAVEKIIFQTYVWRKVGKRDRLELGLSLPCPTKDDALRRVEKVRAGLLTAAGAQAVRMQVDEVAGDYGEPEILDRVGDVPDESE